LTSIGYDSTVTSANTHTSKTNLSSIVYYITGHGFGHAVRSSQVVRNLQKIRPDCAIHVRTTAPEWLFPKSVRYSRQSIDIGIVQRDSLEMDLAATLQSCRLLHEDAPRIIEKELLFIRDHDVRLVVGDIPPLCFEIATRAAVPSVAVTNFAWDGIYSAYQTRHPGFAPIIDEIRQFYAKASLALTLPHACDMNVFSTWEPIPWIARVSRLRKDEARKLFSLPQSATVVLLSFGGLGLQRLPWDKLKKIRNYLFVTTADERKIDGNILILPNAQRHYENLVRAVDVVITKPGYGIVADMIAHRVPALYTDRGEFPEYTKLVEALKHSAVAEFIPQTDLLSGTIEQPLNRILSKIPDWPPVQLNGAQIAAEKILSLM
jgi:UDP:flavonoid glycosyltransferase YjiC (YdhE family)